MVRIVAFLCLVAIVAAGVHAVSIATADRIERTVLRQAEAGRAALGADWASLTADGLLVELGGEAPDEAARDLLVEALRAAAPSARLVDAVSVARPSAGRAHPLIELSRDRTGITLGGRFGSEEMRADLLIALGAGLPGVPVHDLSDVAAAPRPRDWGPEVAVAVAAMRDVPHAFVRIEPARLLVEGVVDGPAVRAALEGELRRVAGPSISLGLSLRVPRVVIVPFAFEASKDRRGRLRIHACAARSEEEAAEIRRLLGARDGIEAAAPCRVGLGGPDLPWDDAVAVSLDALTGLPAARAALVGTELRLTGMPPTGREEFEAALGGVSISLPPGFSLAASLREERPALFAARTGDLKWLTVQRGTGGLTLAGRVGAEPEKIALEALAAAVAGQARVRSELAVGQGTAPATFQQAALGVIEALAAIAPGARVELTPAGAHLSAIVADPLEAVALRAALGARLPEGVTLTSEITVDLPGAVAALPVTPARCAVLVNRAVERRPITFDSGSVRIDAAGARVIDEIAAILGRCAGAAIEIGGHSDNRGGRDLNLRLSEARAEAVRAALLERGVEAHGVVLSARGYGEARPVAPNDTEEGRARNRRIAFTALES